MLLLAAIDDDDDQNGTEKLGFFEYGRVDEFDRPGFFVFCSEGKLKTEEKRNKEEEKAVFCSEGKLKTEEKRNKEEEKE